IDAAMTQVEHLPDRPVDEFGKYARVLPKNLSSVQYSPSLEVLQERTIPNAISNRLLQGRLSLKQRQKRLEHPVHQIHPLGIRASRIWCDAIPIIGTWDIA